MRHRLAYASVAMSLVLTACGTTSTGAPARADAAPETPTTSGTTTPSSVSPSTPTSTTVPAEQALTVVAMGDSVANLSGWPTELAALIESDRGVEVAVDGFSCFGGCTTLTRIEGSVRLQEAVGMATVVVVQPQPGRVVAPVWRDYFAGSCGGDDSLDCGRTALAEFEAYVADLFDTIERLADAETVVLAITTGTWGVDAFYPELRDTDPQAFEDLLGLLVDMGELTQRAAEDRCIGVVDVNALFSGPDYHQPINAAYSDDGKHPSREGSRVIAAALHALLDTTSIRGC